jgi:hypothetical protein
MRHKRISREGFLPDKLRSKPEKLSLVCLALGEKFSIWWVSKQVLDFFETPIKRVSFPAVAGSMFYW